MKEEIMKEFREASATLETYPMYLWLANNFTRLREAGIHIHPSHAKMASKVNQDESRVVYLGHEND